MDYITIFVAQEAIKLSVGQKILTIRSRGQELTLNVPVEFIWFAKSRDYPDSPQVKVKIPRFFCGTSLSFRDGSLYAFVGKYTWSVDMGSEEDYDSPTLTYIEFSVVSRSESIEVNLVRSSEDEKTKVIEYCERFTLKSLEGGLSRKLGPERSFSTRYEGVIYSILTDSQGNTFEVVDNRGVITNTRDLVELYSLVVENQKPMTMHLVDEIMNTGYLDFLFDVRD
jgi:hypothetical protein